MPFIRTTTNLSIPEKTLRELKRDFGEAISLVRGKTESYLMLEFRGDAYMTYQGDESPLAMVEVQLLGRADESDLKALTARLTEILGEKLGIKPERVYVNHSFYENWGAGGSLV